MERHVTILGWLYLGGYGFIVARGLYFSYLAFAEGGPLYQDLLTAALGLIGLVGGYSLFRRWTWGQILVLLLGILNLINIPISPLLGFYTLWVLLKKEGAALFREGKVA